MSKEESIERSKNTLLYAFATGISKKKILALSSVTSRFIIGQVMRITSTHKKKFLLKFTLKKNNKKKRLVDQIEKQTNYNSMEKRACTDEESSRIKILREHWHTPNKSIPHPNQDMKSESTSRANTRAIGILNASWDYEI